MRKKRERELLASVGRLELSSVCTSMTSPSHMQMGIGRGGGCREEALEWLLPLLGVRPVCKEFPSLFARMCVNCRLGAQFVFLFCMCVCIYIYICLCVCVPACGAKLCAN